MFVTELEKSRAAYNRARGLFLRVNNTTGVFTEDYVTELKDAAGKALLAYRTAELIRDSELADRSNKLSFGK